MAGVVTELPLDGAFSVVGRHVVVRLLSIQGNVGNLNTIEACAKINIAGPLEAISLFKASENRGSLFLQLGWWSIYQLANFINEEINLKCVK